MKEFRDTDSQQLTVAINATFDCKHYDQYQYNQTLSMIKRVTRHFLYILFYLDVKGRNLDTEKHFAYRALSRSFLSM